MARPNSASIAPAVVPLALFGIDNNGIGVFINLLAVFLIAIWLSLVFWAYADARRRLTDPVLIGSATLAALIFPFAGALVYAIVRPPETLDEAYERSLDVRAAELRVRMLESAVKGGPGSSAHSASLAADVSGEPPARRAPARPDQQRGQQRGKEPGQQRGKEPRPTRAQEQPASSRASQQRRSSGDQPSRPPSGGA